MPRWLWWSPIILATVFLSVLGLRYGLIVARMSETDVINSYAQSYMTTRQGLGDAKARITDCHAVPGDTRAVWLTVECAAGSGQVYRYPVDLLGRLVTGATAPEGPSI